jgi:NH3-dependent NAD+ synthetase
VEWCPICRAADVLRATPSPELRDQWQAVQREALLTTRALIDSYLERLDGEQRGPRVQDIPIE